MIRNCAFWVANVFLMMSEFMFVKGEAYYQDQPTSYWRKLLLAPSASSFSIIEGFPLRNQPDANAIPVLTELLNDKDASVRKLTVCCLGDWCKRVQPAIPLLITALRDSSSKVQEAAACALGKAGPLAIEAVPTLLKLREINNNRVRFDAVQALWQITRNSRLVIGTLVDILKKTSEDDSYVGYYAFQLLQDMGPDAFPSVPNLIQLFNTSKNEWNRASAAKTLGCIGAIAKPAIPSLGNALMDSSDLVRFNAADAINHISGNTKDTLPIIVSIARNPSAGIYLRGLAVSTLSRFRHDSYLARSVLLELSTDMDREIRQKAVKALNE